MYIFVDDNEKMVWLNTIIVLFIESDTTCEHNDRQISLKTFDNNTCFI